MVGGVTDELLTSEISVVVEGNGQGVLLLTHTSMKYGSPASLANVFLSPTSANFFNCLNEVPGSQETTASGTNIGP